MGEQESTKLKESRRSGTNPYGSDPKESEIATTKSIVALYGAALLLLALAALHFNLRRTMVMIIFIIPSVPSATHHDHNQVV